MEPVTAMAQVSFSFSENVRFGTVGWRLLASFDDNVGSKRFRYSSWLGKL